MNIYSFRTRVMKMRFKSCNFYEAYFIPTIGVGKNNEIDYRKTSVKFGDQEATLRLASSFGETGKRKEASDELLLEKIQNSKK